MRPSDPVSRRGDAPIRALQTVQISPGYSPWFGLRLIANDVMSGPWPQTNKRTNEQTDAPSSNSYLDMKIISAMLALFGHRIQQRALHVIERGLRHEKVK